MMAGILGTMETQGRRGRLDPAKGDGQDKLCRMCGQVLESNSHVLWECTRDRAMVSARREVLKLVRKEFRVAGLSAEQSEAVCKIWELGSLGGVKFDTWEQARQHMEAKDGSWGG